MHRAVFRSVFVAAAAVVLRGFCTTAQMSLEFVSGHPLASGT
jgi:hypothetical protein